MLDSQLFTSSQKFHLPAQPSYDHKNWRASTKIDVNITFTFKDQEDQTREEKRMSIMMPKEVIPPLFSPHVLNTTLQQIVTYKSGSYMDKEAHLAPHMMDNSVVSNPPVLNSLCSAERFKIHVEWMRKLDVYIHQARNFGSSSKKKIQNVYCKLVVGNQIERTKGADPEPQTQALVWNASFSFNVMETTNIIMYTIGRNSIFPNDRLGKIVILPKELVERSTITKWFPLDSNDGEVNMSISLSAPWVAPFKFTIDRMFLSTGVYTVRDAKETEVFKLCAASVFRDAQNLPLLNVKHRSSCSVEVVFDIYRHGQFAPCMAVKRNFEKPEKDSFEILGLMGVDAVLIRRNTFKFYNTHTGTCVACANFSFSALQVEVNPDQDVVLILAAFVVIAKIIQCSK